VEREELGRGDDDLQEGNALIYAEAALPLPSLDYLRTNKVCLKIMLRDVYLSSVPESYNRICTTF
jgi:hypothetical protein